jgi:hypothetical protein
MSTLKIKGTVHAISEIQSVSDKFKKRNVVLSIPGQYESFIAFDLTQDRVTLADNLNEGQEVEVSINIKSREYNSKWYTNVEGWKIEATALEQQKSNKTQASSTTSESIGTPDDLPF